MATLKPKSWLRRWTQRTLAALTAVYLTATLVVTGCQTSLIYPGAVSQHRPDAQLQTDDADYQLLQLHAADGIRIGAIFGPALAPDGTPDPEAAHRPTVIYDYGNGECVAHDIWTFQRLRRLDVNVILPDYEGYGMSGGSPTERGCYAAADAAYAYLLQRHDVDSSRIIAFGTSLGTGIAIDLASRKPVAALVTISAYTRMEDMAHLLFPILPTSIMLQSKFDSLSKIPRVQCPMLIAHGQCDKYIPPAMSDTLAAAARAPVTRIRILTAGHNDMLAHPEMWTALSDFFNSVATPETAENIR